MKHEYEAIVIGAGPAGAACGITLQKSGITNCVIDKAVFPRSKTCAGLVTGKTYKLIEQLFDNEVDDGIFCAVSSEVRLFSKTELLTAAPITKPVRLVNRIDFDNALVKRYLQLGGHLFQGEQYGRCGSYHHFNIYDTQSLDPY